MQKARRHRRASWIKMSRALRRLDVPCRLLAALHDHFIADLLALVQRAHACALDGADMDEHVLGAIVRLNEAEAFLSIEELHGTNGHQFSFHASLKARRIVRRAQQSEFWEVT